MTGAIPSDDQSHKSVSAGNGSCITATTPSSSELEIPPKVIRDTRSLSSSAAMTFMSTHPIPSMTIGNSGQISSISLTDLVRVQRRCRSRRRGDANTTFRHLRHTCTSVCHQSSCSKSSSSSSSAQKSNISRRISSGSVPIVTCRRSWPMPLKFSDHLKRDKRLTTHLCCLRPIALFADVQCPF